LKDNIAATFETSIGAQHYEIQLTHPRLLNTPKWSKDREAPPLAPRKAILAATQYLAKLTTDGDKWEVVTVQLMPKEHDRWIYIVELEPPGPLAGKWMPTKVVVLMDGSVVEATLK